MKSPSTPPSPKQQLALLQAEKQQWEQEKQAFEKRTEELQKETQQLSEQNLLLKAELAEMKRLLFGSKRERFVPTPGERGQLSLELEGTEGQPPEEATVKQVAGYRRAVKKARAKTVRGPLPAHLPRVEVVLEPEGRTAGMRKVGEEVTEELELEPARLFVRRFIRPRYVDREECFHIAPMPCRPIEKGMAGPFLLAQLLIDKFFDHLPLYRQRQRLARLGMELPASTIDGWVAATCALIEPLYLCLRAKVLGGTYLQADETPLPVLDRTKKGKTHRGYHWLYHSPEQRLVFLEYQKGRNQQFPAKVLAGYGGYLQVDGYAGYDQFEKKKEMALVACMAHIRRKFERALDNDAARAGFALGRMQQLYAIERQAREQGLSPEERYGLRQRQALPLMEELGEWAMTALADPGLLPKSNIAVALGYFIKQYPRMSRYLEDGRLEIDNNLIENTVRPVALGRKNYLFAGSHEGARRAAMVYSLLGSCKLHGINPNKWLPDVFARLPDHPVNRLEELLPHKWQPAKVGQNPEE